MKTKSIPKGLRPEVIEFAKAMEKVLKENDYKMHWTESDVHSLFEKAKREMRELEESLGYICRECGEKHEPSTLHKPEKECVDVANFMMMIFDLIKKYNKKYGGE